MALAPRLADAAKNASADAVAALCNAGLLRIYDGSQPADPDSAITTQTLLAELTFGNPAFGAASGGVATANAITPDSSANASGTATWFRVVKSDGTTKVMDGSVGTATSNLVLNSNVIVAGAVVACTDFTYTQPES